MSVPVAALSTLALSAGVLAAGAQAAVPPPSLAVTEIAPDNSGNDDFEFFEVANTGTVAVDVSADRAGLAYIYVDSEDRTRDVALQVPAGTVVPAGGTTVFWVSYTSTTVDSFARAEQEFRDHWAGGGKPADDYPLVRVTGQPGMANGGSRGIRATDGTGASSWSYYPAESVAVDASAHFRVGADGAAATSVLEAQGRPTPGAVAPEALIPVPGPTPDPEPSSDPQPSTDPQPSSDPQPSTDPQPMPAGAPLLQVTELLPDSTNVGTADGFEFVEIYNASAEPVDFGDFTLDYLYPGSDLVPTTVVQWPSSPRSVVIPPAGTLVLWVKNGSNDGLSDADFNAQFGTALTMGTDLVEVFVGGMANGSPRGLQVVTNTGFAVSTAYYNLDGADDTAADQGIQYAVDPVNPGRQVLLGQAPASPGSVTADQVPAGPVVLPAGPDAPVVEDRTAAEVDPATDFTVDLIVTDDVQVRTVTLELRSSADEVTQSFNLEAEDADRYRYVVPVVDLTGKRWLEYRVVASDGTRTTATEVRRVAVAGVDTSPVRLGLEEGQFVTGTTRLWAAGDTYPAGLTLSVDGTDVASTTPSLEAAPVFAFEATATDAFFRNGVLVGEEVLHVFDEGFYAEEVTVATEVPLRLVQQGQDTVVSIYAGTKAWPQIDPAENNDDFQVRNLRLVLPDGRTLRPAGAVDPTQWLAMGDSTGKLEFIDAAFALPADAFTAVAHEWDTTALVDGEHTVVATDGSTTVSRTVRVDNTAPAITTTLEDGRLYQGELVIDAQATDAGAGVASLTAQLDGRDVALPHTTSSLDLPAGEHRVVLTARDELGNTSTREVRFSTPEEQPSGTPLSPADGTTVETGDVELRAGVEDPAGDALDVELREGHRYVATDAEVTAYSGETPDAAGTDRADKVLLTGTDLADMVGNDGVDAEVSSGGAFPYQLFEVAVPQDAGAGAQVRIGWDGRANADAKILLHVLDTTTGSWREVDRELTTGDRPTDIALEATVPVADHAVAGVMTVLVQHSEGFAGTDLSTRESAVEAGHVDDVPRTDYDFTIGWESDTQYYNEAYYQRQLDIHDYFLDRRDDVNLQYVIHTGDIVDDWDQEYQWLNADPAYAMLDDARLPYGVLAGNHDVGGAQEDYGPYSRWFGTDRYATNPWYGESYQDNRGHYDLITAGGVDLILLYQGWGPGDEEIAWMNDVLARFPERKAIVNLHEYMLTNGGLGPVPQQIQDEVVATNPNVMMVTGGHYHDAFTRTDAFDDDGDGAPDRTVTQMLFDYQGLPEGGQAFLRLLHFDNAGGRVMVRTFSPYLDRYNSDDPALDLVHQEFDVSYADLGITPRTKVLATDALSVEVLTDRALATFTDVASGTEVVGTWADVSAGEHSWYVVTRDAYGAVDRSPVVTFTAIDAPAEEPDAREQLGLLREALEAHMASGAVPRPTGQRLDTELRLAERQLVGGRPDRALAPLERALGHLQGPQVDQMEPAARADLTARIQEVVDTLS